MYRVPASSASEENPRTDAFCQTTWPVARSMAMTPPGPGWAGSNAVET